ncbi:MAG: histidinol dehydrogenase [Candidatus Melainabacteria bacterium RIFCSPLOWO2_02_FULL_35_15]|nr:MAG: histidinol dehydrogenase [Candidatus Melainabacteria bacterium RIFCSPLOWO2_12_FULL_35_11]OGI13201.1 MAG: histidinol dehydrogenase [Candidatus Melainabacteria bacterium RIFCSPLOWO2_02_FULL_35_15]
MIIKDLKKAKKKIKDILSRFDPSEMNKEYKSVQVIVNNVKKNGDKALIYYTKKFDEINLKSIKVSPVEIKNSTNHISKLLLLSIKKAIKRIIIFQKTNVPKTWIKTFNSTEKLGYKYIPLDSAGIYIPGGQAPLISTVYMTATLAKAAGVKRIVIFTPPPANKGILAVCKLLRINEVYQIGGAQAISAAAFGTESIQPVNKIVGPGNIYVTLAKKIVFGKIGIDGLYGPSEIAIIADKSANPKLLAVDLLSQLEHGSGLESAFMATNSEQVAKATEKELFRLAQHLPNKKTVLKSWKNNSAIVIVRDLNRACKLINLLAPEHLEIMTKNALSLSKKIKNAGAVFLGEYSCESIGDYIAGPSHCLPTGGSAKFSSGLTVMDFMKKISVISFNKKDFRRIAKDVINLADAEGLKAHENAVRMRLE